MKTSSAKAKGRRLASEIKDLLHLYAPDLQPGDIEVTSSGCTGVDLKLSPAARLKYPFAIECKNQEKISIWDALEQSESHIEYPGPKETSPQGMGHLTNMTAILFFRRNRTKIYVALDAEQFIRMIS